MCVNLNFSRQSLSSSDVPDFWPGQNPAISTNPAQPIVLAGYGSAAACSTHWLFKAKSSNESSLGFLRKRHQLK